MGRSLSQQAAVSVVSSRQPIPRPLAPFNIADHVLRLSTVRIKQFKYSTASPKESYVVFQRELRPT